MSILEAAIGWLAPAAMRRLHAGGLSALREVFSLGNHPVWRTLLAL